MSLERFVNQVWHGDAREFLPLLPSASVDAVLSDAMYGTAKNCQYEWGVDPAKGEPEKHWAYHKPIYQECLRVLKPGGILAWGQGFKFVAHFDAWFGQHRIWTPICLAHGLNFNPNVWIVQTKEGHPVEHPNDMIVPVDRKLFKSFKAVHPCPKPVEEMKFLVEHLTRPGDVVLDCFAGIGATLLAAKQGRNYIGCDISRLYCQIAMGRLAA